MPRGAVPEVRYGRPGGWCRLGLAGAGPARAATRAPQDQGTGRARTAPLEREQKGARHIRTRGGWAFFVVPGNAFPRPSDGIPNSFLLRLHSAVVNANNERAGMRTGGKNRRTPGTTEDVAVRATCGVGRSRRISWDNL